MEEDLARDIAEVPAVEVINTTAVHLMSAAAVQCGLSDDTPGDLAEALAQDLKIIDAVSGPEVKRVIVHAVKEVEDVVMAGVSAGDPEARLVAEEIIIEVGMRPGLTAEGLETALTSFVAHLRVESLDDFVDSFKLKIISAI